MDLGILGRGQCHSRHKEEATDRVWDGVMQIQPISNPVRDGVPYGSLLAFKVIGGIVWEKCLQVADLDTNVRLEPGAELPQFHEDLGNLELVYHTGCQG